MENPEKKFQEEKFKNTMKAAGLEKLIKPTSYRAVIKHFAGEKPTVLKEFKTEKEYEEWYKSDGAAYEDSAQGRIELEEVFDNNDVESFEHLMKRNGLEGIVGKEGYMFIVRGRDEDDEKFKVLMEFESKDEAEDWYNSLGRLVIEGGGELMIDYGPSELKDK